MGKASVNALKGNLYLLARLPKKDGTGVMPQRIPMRLPDTAANRRVVERRRAVLQRQIDTGTFVWSDWIDEDNKAITWQKAISMLYRKRVVLGRTGENTWRVSYMGRLRQNDMNKAVTTQEVERWLNRWGKDSCSYKEAFYLGKDLCQLIAIDFPEMPIPTYSKGRITDVPEDHEILEWITKAADHPELAWAMGMMATYGLRPHELDECEFIDSKHRLKIVDETKTGFRIVVPVPFDWVELLDLRNERRRVKTSTRVGATCQWLSTHRKKLGFPYVPYALRHAYAGRLWRFGGSELDIYTAARLMGHSVQTHERKYREWIAPHTIALKAEEALSSAKPQGYADSLRNDPDRSASRSRGR